MQRFCSWTTRLGIAALASSLGIGCVALLSFAQEGTIAKDGAPAKQAPGEKPKTFAFDYRDAPWEQVLNFLADNCRMPVVGSQRPQGSFTFVSPANMRYTIPQIVDILNSRLIAQKMLIIREPDKFVVLSTDANANELEMQPLLRVQIDDLEVDKPYDQQKYGRSELAQVNFKLNSLSPDEAETNLAANKSPFGKMAKIPRANSILVSDTVNNLRRMKKLLDEIDGSGGDQLEVFQLRGTADGSTLKTTLDTNFGAAPGKPTPVNAPVITFDAASNKLLVKGNKTQLTEVKNILTNFGAIRPTVAVKPPEPGAQGAQPPAGKAPVQETEDSIRTIPVKTDVGKSSTVSDYVSNCAYMLKSLRSNPVEVTLEPVLPQRLEELRKGAKIAEKKQGKEQLSEEKQQKSEPNIPNKPGRPDKPILLAPMNRFDAVMVGSDDPEAIDFAEQILGYLTKAGDDNYEIIPLKNASAQTVKDTLEELLIGKKQQNGPMMGMPFMMGQNPRETLTGPTIRLAADKRSNSIIVRAPRQIIVTIKRFIETELDVSNIDQRLQPKPRFWKLEHAAASDVVDVVKELYKDYMDQNQRNSTISPFGPFGPRVPNPNQPQDSDRTIRLTIAANTKDNGIIANCPDVLYDELDYLVTKLDQEATEPSSSIKVIRFGKKIDPTTLQAVMNVITGNNTQVPGTNTNGANNFQNRFGPGGFGRGGFGGGGFGGGGMGGMGGGGGGRGGGGGPRGGGGMGPRGGNRSDQPPSLISEAPPGGSDFFAGRVTDDPRKPVQQLIYNDDDEKSDNVLFIQTPTQPTTFQPPRAQPGGQNQGQQPPNITANTRGTTNVIVTPEGNVIVTGSKEDIEVIENLLRLMAQEQEPIETELRLFKLKYYDPTSMVNLLNAIYARYNPTTGVIGAAQARPGGGFGGPGGGAPGGGGGGGGFFGNLLAQAAQGGQNAGVAPAGGSGSILLLAVPRLNSILIGAPKSLFAEIEKTIEMFDKPNTPDANPQIIPLRRANAQLMANTLTQFYQQRYPNEQLQQNEIRISPDAKTNSLIVHAGPADLEEIRKLLEFFDKAETRVVNQFRIKTLKFAVASDMATLMQQALSQAIYQNVPTTGTPGQGGLGLPGQGGPFGGQGNPFGGQQPGGGLFGGNQLGGGGPFGGQRPGGLGTGLGAAQQQQTQRGVNLQFAQGAQRFQTGLLEDVGFFPDVRTNRLIISAPPESVDLIDKLVDELDVPPTLIADVKVFTLKKTDASQAANTLQQIYFGTGTTGTTGGINRPGGGGFPTGGTGLGGQQSLNTQLTTGQGPQAIQMRFAIDPRTNSLIVAGSHGDVLLAQVLLERLESSDIREREYAVIRLRNNQAGNVASILSNFFGGELTILQGSAELGAFTLAEHQITVYPDATNNSIALAASPRFMPEVKKIIEQLDVELAQVAIQVLMAQVTLDNFDDFGVEIGVQSPIFFQRSQTSPTATGGGTPGFNFNNLSALPNATNAHPDVVALQGLSNYGTQRASGVNGLGGFVFSASSDGLNVLVRALRTQGRVEILSRPQIITRDNQQALISVGQQVPIIDGSTVGATGNITNTVTQQQVGVILKVLPQISPDGHVVMRVEPQISSVSNSTVDLGNGVKGTIIDQTIASTTIDALDGSTVAIGGLLTKQDEKHQTGIPWLCDLPYVGAAFRYRSQQKTKTELLILLTPHVIRSPADAERVFLTEAGRMSWTLADVQAMHGTLPNASFLESLRCNTGLPESRMINPFDNNFMTPAPAPDEKLNPPAKAPTPPQPQPPANQPQTPPWLLPPGVTPPPGQPVGLAPNQGAQTPTTYPYSAGNGLPPSTNGSPNSAASQKWYQSAAGAQPMQTEQNGKWTTTVIYGPQGGAAPSTPPVNNQTNPPMAPTGFAGGQ
jgi:type II secretory pathway component GspD/PulD (secretin)